MSQEASPTTPERTFDVDERAVGLAYSKAHIDEVPVGLLYRQNDPTAITLRFFPDSRKPKDWTFSRRVLARGYFESSGGPDVQVEPWENETILIKLNPPKATQFRIVLPQRSVQSFLDQSYETVSVRDEAGLIAGALDNWLEANIPIIPAPTETPMEGVPV